LFLNKFGIPEPSTLGMIGLAAGAAAIGRSFRRNRGRRNDIFSRNHQHSRNTGRQ